MEVINWYYQEGIYFILYSKTFTGFQHSFPLKSSQDYVEEEIQSLYLIQFLQFHVPLCSPSVFPACSSKLG